MTASPSGKTNLHNGVVVLDKPAGITSHDCVNKLRRIFLTKRVGHCGTLDPIATGVLLVCVGNATRIAEYLTSKPKRYVAIAEFGKTSTTQDRTGEIITDCGAESISASTVEDVMRGFTGHIKQLPPMVSALHHNGQRLYDLARKGVEVERELRDITIYALQLLDFTPGRNPIATLDITCSTGTYIRTLIHDIGEKLGVGGIMNELRRTAVGDVDISKAITLPELNDLSESKELSNAVIPITDALPDWPRVILDQDQVSDILHGRQIVVPDTTDCETAFLLDEANDLVALAKVNSCTIQPFKVFLQV